MNPAEARAKLIAQHDRLRVELAKCRELARRERRGEEVAVELDAALARLRFDFAEHNTTETALIRPLLHGSAQWGALLVDRMLEEHVGEHTAFWQMMTGSAADVAARMDELVDELDAHMAAEERTFLNPSVLHPETIARHRQQEPSS